MEPEITPNKRGPAAMTDEHKAALATGRKESRAVKEYLEALLANKPKRGRRRTPESISKRLSAIADENETANPLIKLQLVQERMDLEAELEAMSETVDMSGLEAAFVGVAAAYGERKGISYAAWRELGVDAAVLRQAGVGRGA
jgi:hypothetical protein